MRIALITLFVITISSVFGQYPGSRSSLTKTTAKGSLFFYWGYNRSAYTKSDLRLVSDQYDLTLKGVKATDNPYPFSARNYLNIKRITIPQFNIRLGYYFKNNWSISGGYDHLKYVLSDGNQVQLYGHVDEGYDTVTNLSGNYYGESFITNQKTFHYENSDGLNYLRLELMHSMELYSLGREKQLSIVWNAGIGSGAMLTFNDLRFAGREDRTTVSISGYGLSIHSGLRIEFFRHFFIQPAVSAGMIHLLRVRTRGNDPYAYAKQIFGYSEFNTVAGALFYIKPKKDCDCPKW